MSSENVQKPKNVQFPALTQLVATTIKGSQITDEFIKQAENRHELKIRQEIRRQRPAYQFLHVFHRWIKVSDFWSNF